MSVLDCNVKKICSFYVNDWHLTVMLLPYIKEELKKQKEIITMMEQNLEDNVTILLTKLKFQEEIKKEIKKIHWNANANLKYTEIEKRLKQSKKETTIIVSGGKEYIEKINMKLEKYTKNNKKQKIKIINCYEVSNFNENIKKVLDCHDAILNTGGEKPIEEVFEGYKRVSNQ